MNLRNKDNIEIIERKTNGKSSRSQKELTEKSRKAR